ncbi:carbohydrate kinase family protein (plasmid) [Streptomyces sp. NBC_01456]|uniref:carbohydrate kinase family protein n=1 Tax=unclassified Streptomyces TaxID=2593676 RepID=UPI002E30EA87|nr:MULTISPECIES: carbohydrate kinase family protein [unclassified Streptomyces]
MQRTIVIGNISLDHIHRPGHPPLHQLGGAALHLAAAAARAGLPAAPAASIGSDLAHLPDDPRLPALDWTLLHHAPQSSAAFTIHYDRAGTVTAVDTAYGAAEHLTAHALRVIDRHPQAVFHISGRRPLDLPAVLGALTTRDHTFSLDFHLPSAPHLIPAAAPWLHHATTVFVNAEEHLLLTQSTGSRPCPEVVVTDGPRPAYVVLNGRPGPPVVPPAVPTLRQITGAGDTLAGTYLAHRARGIPPGAALTHAVQAASRHTTQHPLTLAPHRAPP